jgi:hypothetical protein
MRLLMSDSDPSQALFNAIGTLSHIDFNIWPYLFFIALPIITFTLRPDSPARAHIFRIMIAVFLGYIFINASLHTSYNITWDTYRECQNQFPDGAIQHHKECGERNVAGGASFLFMMVLGWAPAMVYLGMWELIWRYRHRNQLQTMNKKFKGKWIRTATLWAFYASLAWVTLATVSTSIAYLIYHW